jgi:hypothetical protein
MGCKGWRRDAQEEPADDKIAWQSVLLSVQPRIRLIRSFDQRSDNFAEHSRHDPFPRAIQIPLLWQCRLFLTSAVRYVDA